MIKKLFFLCLLLLSNLAYAQSTEAPTKQDAIDFINKVLVEYKGNLDEAGLHYEGFETISARLDGCNLIFTMKFRTNNANVPLIMVNDIMTEYHTNTVTINLQNIYFGPNENLLDKTFRANNTGDITEISSTETININGKSVGVSNSPPQNFAEYLVVRPLQHIYQYGPLTDDHHYSERYVNAVLFLVKACGGGQMKTQTDSGDKF